VPSARGGNHEERVMLTIYGVPVSVHVRKIVVTAKLKGIAYAIDPVIPFNPPDNWGSLSPTGLIPAMRDDDFTLAESTAICLYMEHKRASPQILPADARDCSRALFFDGYAGYVFRNMTHGLFFQKVVSPRILRGETDESVVDKILTTTAPRIFGYLESQVTGRFLVGDRLTLADLGIASNLINYQYLGFTIDKTRYPALAGYIKDVVALEPFQQALAGEKPFAEQMGLDRSFVA
jgi:glutathione S-transferase